MNTGGRKRRLRFHAPLTRPRTHSQPKTTGAIRTIARIPAGPIPPLTPALDGGRHFLHDGYMDATRPRDPVAQRHPICPYCEYNLRGSFDRSMRSVRCPECGEEFEAAEVRWSNRKGDWTLAVGIRSAFLFLLVRGALAMVILTASVVLLELLGEMLSRTAGGFRFGFAPILVIQLIFGLPTGKALSSGFEDAAGFSSALLPLASIATLVCVGLVIGAVLPLVYTLAHAPLGPMLFTACAVAVVVILVDYLREVA